MPATWELLHSVWLGPPKNVGGRGGACAPMGVLGRDSFLPHPLLVPWGPSQMSVPAEAADLHLPLAAMGAVRLDSAVAPCASS